MTALGWAFAAVAVVTCLVGVLMLVAGLLVGIYDGGGRFAVAGVGALLVGLAFAVLALNSTGRPD